MILFLFSALFKRNIYMPRMYVINDDTQRHMITRSKVKVTRSNSALTANVDHNLTTDGYIHFRFGWFYSKKAQM